MNNKFFSNFLIGYRFKRIYHYWELICLSFVNEKKQYNFHVQSEIRIINSTAEEVFNNRRLFLDEHSNNYIDKKLDSINTILYNTHITSISSDKIGNLQIEVQNKNREDYFIFINIDTNEDEEKWRLIEVGTNTPHLVCYPNHLELE